MYVPKIFPFRLVTFDVTNTLLNFRANIGKTYSDVGSKHGVKCDPDQLSTHFKREFKKMILKHPNYGKNTGMSWVKWWNVVVCETFKNCQDNLNETQLDSICTDLINLYCTPVCWKPAIGSLELLNYLRDRGVSLGVISNTDPRLHVILKNMNLDSYFTFVLTSYESGISKPDRRIFEQAMMQSDLPRLKKEECLHIGDTLEFDHKGATNSGWNSYLVYRNRQVKRNSKSELNFQNIFNDLQNLKDYLEHTWDQYHVQ